MHLDSYIYYIIYYNDNEYIILYHINYNENEYLYKCSLSVCLYVMCLLSCVCMIGS